MHFDKLAVKEMVIRTSKCSIKEIHFNKVAIADIKIFLKL